MIHTTGLTDKTTIPPKDKTMNTSEIERRRSDDTVAAPRVVCVSTELIAEGGPAHLGDSEATLAADLPPPLDALVAPAPRRLAQVVHHRLQEVHEEHCPVRPAPMTDDDHHHHMASHGSTVWSTDTTRPAQKQERQKKHGTPGTAERKGGAKSY